MKTSSLIKVLERGGWQQNRKINQDIIFNHPAYRNLISIPDLGEQTIKPELLNEIFQAAGLKARIYKKALNPAHLLNRLKHFINPTE